MKTSSTFSAGPIGETVDGVEVWWTMYPQEIPEDYRKAIGDICSRWSWLEFQLGVIAREILEVTKPGGFAALGGMDMGAITNVLISLSAADFMKDKPELREQVEKIGRKLHGIYKLRNQYIHGVWGYEKASNQDLGIWRFNDPDTRSTGENWQKKTINEMQNDIQNLKDYQVWAQKITDDTKAAFRKK